jgi:hypothetical protein
VVGDASGASHFKAEGNSDSMAIRYSGDDALAFQVDFNKNDEVGSGVRLWANHGHRDWVQRFHWNKTQTISPINHTDGSVSPLVVGVDPATSHLILVAGDDAARKCVFSQLRGPAHGQRPTAPAVQHMNRGGQPHLPQNSGELLSALIAGAGLDTHKVVSVGPATLQFEVHPHCFKQLCCSLFCCIPCVLEECKIDYYEMNRRGDLRRDTVTLCGSSSQQWAGSEKAYLGRVVTINDGHNDLLTQMGEVKIRLQNGNAVLVSRGGMNSTGLASKRKLYKAVNDFLGTTGVMNVSTMDVSMADAMGVDRQRMCNRATTVTTHVTYDPSQGTAGVTGRSFN